MSYRGVGSFTELLQLLEGTGMPFPVHLGLRSRDDCGEVGGGIKLGRRIKCSRRYREALQPRGVGCEEWSQKRRGLGMGKVPAQSVPIPRLRQLAGRPVFQGYGHLEIFLFPKSCRFGKTRPIGSEGSVVVSQSRMFRARLGCELAPSMFFLVSP